MMHFDHLLVTEVLNTLQGQIIALATNCADIETRFARRADCFLRPRIVRKDNGGAPFSISVSNSRIFAAI